MTTTEKTLMPYLHGAGIVSGLRVTRQFDQNIVLESGYGYSSDGLPFAVDSTLFTHYTLLNQSDDMEKVALFEYFGNLTKQPVANILFWELLTEGDVAATNFKLPLRLLKPQSPADTEGGIFLDDKIVVLFRNSLDTRLRVLLMGKKEVAAFTFSKDFQWKDVIKHQNEGDNAFSIFGHAVASDPSVGVSDHDLYLYLNPALQLPVLAIRRFGYADLILEDFTCDDPYQSIFCRTDDPKGHILSNFDSICTEYATIIDKLRPDMAAAITAFHTHFGAIIGNFAVSLLNQHWHTFEARWCAFREIQTATEKVAMQYWYGAFADLTTAFNELRAAALRYKTANAPETTAFRHHLLLGSLPAEPNFALPNPFRTAFQQPPTENGQAEQLARVRFLHWRLVMMMKSFYAPTHDVDDLASDSPFAPPVEVNDDNPLDAPSKINMPIRLTPSRHLSVPLGERTIPYYFDLGNSEQSLHWFWDFDATQQHRATEHLSYHSENETAFRKKHDGDFYAGTEGGSYTHVQPVIHPFVFDTRALPFIRIEGHIGKTAATPAFEMKDAQGNDKNAQDKKLNLETILTDLAKRFNICFTVEFLEAKAIIKNANGSINPSELTKLCGKCANHIGGVYHGGTFYIVYEDITPPQAANKIYKIVADFSSHDSPQVKVQGI